VRTEFAEFIQTPLDSLLAINSADALLASNQTELRLASAYFQVRRVGGARPRRRGCWRPRALLQQLAASCC
jgi:hypothetical protein